MDAIGKSGVSESILAFANFKQNKELKKTDGAKRSRLLGGSQPLCIVLSPVVHPVDGLHFSCMHCVCYERQFQRQRETQAGKYHCVCLCYIGDSKAGQEIAKILRLESMH
jgi:hypothetical protein